MTRADYLANAIDEQKHTMAKGSEADAHLLDVCLDPDQDRDSESGVVYLGIAIARSLQ